MKALPAARYIGKILLLALLYMISGKLGLMLAVPPGYATVIWPASGIAIGMLLVNGPGLWPGILIGSFILNCCMSGAFSFSEGFLEAKTTAAAMIACGSTLQALMGRALIKRFLGFPLRLRHIKEVILLFLLSGPATCTIAATTGVSALYLTGVLPVENIVGNWVTWWLGDTFGVFIFMPLVLMAPGSRDKLVWRGSELGTLPLLAMMALIVPLGLTFYSWKIVSESHYQTVLDQFKALTEDNERALLHRINTYNYALLGGAGFFQGSDFVSREEWRKYIDAIEIDENFKGINGMGVITPVEPAKLPDFLKKVREDGAPDFNIHPDTEDKPYYIITYVQPFTSNAPASGLNIAFEENRKGAAELSRDTGLSAITKRIVLIQDQKKTPSFLLLHPMYDLSMPANTMEERRQALRGWIFAPFIAKNFMNNLTKSQEHYLHLEVYDGSDISPESLIFDDEKTQEHNAKNPPDFTIRKKITIMQNEWTLVWRSTKAFERENQSEYPLFVITGGLLFTGLFGLFLMTTMVRRTETIELLAAERKFALPMIIFIVTSAGSFYLFDVINNREEIYIKSVVSAESKKIRQLIHYQAIDKLTALQRMAQRWEIGGRTPENLWRADAANYREHLRGLKAMEWVDSSYHVHWVEPLQGNEKAVGLDIRIDEKRAETLKAASEKDTITLLPPLDLVQGYKAFIAYAPLKVDHKFDGFIVGLFSVDEFFEEAIAHEAANSYAIYLDFDGEEFFHNNVSSESLVPELGVTNTLTVYDRQIVVRTVPTQTFVNSQRTRLSSIVLTAGLLIAILLSLTVRYVLISRLRSRYLEKSYKEIAEKTERLAESEERYDLAVRGLSVGVWDWNIPDNQVYRSRKFKEIIGIEAQEVKPHYGELTGRIHPEDRDTVLGMLQDHIDRKGAYDIEYRMKHEKGHYIWIHATGQCHWDENGKPLRMVGSIADITESKQNEEERRKMVTLVEESADYIGMADLTGKLQYHNRSARRMIGLPDDYDLSQLKISDMHPEWAFNLLTAEAIPTTFEHGFWAGETAILHRNGTEIPVLQHLALHRDAKGEPVYFTTVMRDITKVKEVERMKGEFISIVSHELRTPLTSIRGALGLITGTMSKDLPEKAGHLIDIAHKNSERLILLINDMLDIDKISSGQLKFDIRTEAIAPLIIQAVETNQPYAHKFGVTVMAEPVEADLKIAADPARLLQVLANLISNAAKFSSEGGKVEVSTIRKNGKIRISVKDSGPGIAEEFRPRIFEKFSQADSVLTRKKGGTGLGLHISKQIIEGMNGEIGFDTEVGKGTTFWFEFPEATI